MRQGSKTGKLCGLSDFLLPFRSENADSAVALEIRAAVTLSFTILSGQNMIAA
jgi:hypothetical protein